MSAARAVGEDAVDLDRVGHQALHLIADRGQPRRGKLGQGVLEAREGRIAEFAQDVLSARLGEAGIDADEIVGLGPRLEPLHLRRQRLGIGLRLFDLLGDGIGIVGQIDPRHVGLVRLRHFARAVAQAHDPGRRPGDERLGQREEAGRITFARDRSGEVVVEFLGDVARKLKMLLLVVADRNMSRVVEQNVRRHKVRIDIEAGGGLLAVFARLLLELRHAVQPAEPRHAIEDPGKLGVPGDLALVEDDVAGGIDARGDEGGRDLAGVLGKLFGVLEHGDGVEIDHAIEAVMLGLERHEFGDGAEIVAEMEIAGRLHAGEDAGPGLVSLHVVSLPQAGLWRRPRRGATAALAARFLDEVAKIRRAQDMRRAEIGGEA